MEAYKDELRYQVPLNAPPPFYLEGDILYPWGFTVVYIRKIITWCLERNLLCHFKHVSLNVSEITEKVQLVDFGFPELEKVRDAKTDSISGEIGNHLNGLFTTSSNFNNMLPAFRFRTWK